MQLYIASPTDLKQQAARCIIFAFVELDSPHPASAIMLCRYRAGCSSVSAVPCRSVGCAWAAWRMNSWKTWSLPSSNTITGWRGDVSSQSHSRYGEILSFSYNNNINISIHNFIQSADQLQFRCKWCIVFCVNTRIKKIMFTILKPFQVVSSIIISVSLPCRSSYQPFKHLQLPS